MGETTHTDHTTGPPAAAPPSLTASGRRSRGFAPNPMDHVRAEQAAARLVVIRELEQVACRAGLR